MTCMMAVMIGAAVELGCATPPSEHAPGTQDASLRASAASVNDDCWQRPLVTCNLPAQPINLRSNWNANLWPTGIVPFVFDGNTSPAQQNAMWLAMNEIEAVCAARFVPRTSQVDYLHIRDSTVNSSFVGMMAGAQEVNIFNWNFRFIMAHELMHALGIWHEQQRPDRANYVTINYGNIQAGQAHNFDIVGSPVGTYDFESVMHYDACAFSTCCPAGSSCGCALSCAAIQALPAYAGYQELMGQRSQLSAGDRAGLASRYGLPSVINISATIDCEQAGGVATATLAPGTYIALPMSSGGGGVWDAWSPAAATSGCPGPCCTAGWLWSYNYRVNGGPWRTVGTPGCARPDPGSAFSSQSAPETFAVAAPGFVEFRHVDSNCADNRGGVSIRVARCAAITVHPVARQFCSPPASVSFSITAVGDDIGYQWMKDGAVITNGGRYSGTDTANLVIASPTSADAGLYSCQVGNIFTCGFVTSSPAPLQISNAGPIIQRHPPDLTATSGSTARLEVGVTGVSPITYQWRRNGLSLVNGGRISGATSAVLQITGFSSSDAGAYDVVVSDACGARVSTSSAATVTCGDVWTRRLDSMPIARSHGVMVFDSARANTVLFGGDNTRRNSNLGDTWTWDGQAWTQRMVDAPSARRYAGAAYDSARQRVVLFGGLTNAGTNVGDTWEWNGAGWSIVATTGPSARQGAMVAYDAARQRTVLFGGYDGTFDRQTWEWDGTAWSHRTSSGPAARLLGAMAFDAARGVCVLFGGSGSTSRLNDTWEWNGTAWIQRSPATSPSPRDSVRMVYDAVRQKCVLFGGGLDGGGALDDTWDWDGTSWMQSSTGAPSARRGTQLAYDSSRGRVVMFGGYRTGAEDLDELWERSGTTWSRPLSPQPPARYGGGLVYDSTRNRCLLFGGYSTQLLATLSDTWEWDGSSWTRQSVAGPGDRRYFNMVFDSVRGQAVLFGGFDGTDYLGQTWEWNGSTWSVPTTTGPTSRQAVAMAFDSRRGRTVLFGGLNLQGLHSDTWEFDGTTWVQMNPADHPVARQWAAMAYDEARGVCVLYGGSTSPTTVEDDTWTWNGTTWTRRLPATSPGGLEVHAMVYDAARQRAVLYGGVSGGNMSNNTWEWDGVNWAMAPDSGGGTSPRATAHQLAYDRARRMCVHFGGDVSGSSSGDTWERQPVTATVILSHPSSVSVELGASTSFTVTAKGGPYMYQWRKGGVNLIEGGRFAGTQTRVLSITPNNSDIGYYDVIISGDCGALTSNSALLTLTPSPLCPADFNISGGVSVQDIFDFLAAYFASCAAPAALPCYGSADFNGSGSISVQDIFDFLAAYFAGCP